MTCPVNAAQLADYSTSRPQLSKSKLLTDDYLLTYFLTYLLTRCHSKGLAIKTVGLVCQMMLMGTSVTYVARTGKESRDGIVVKGSAGKERTEVIDCSNRRHVEASALVISALLR